MEEHLYEVCGAGEGPVCGEEDPAVVLFLAARIKEVIHQLAQVSGLQSPHLAGSVVDKSAALIGLTGAKGVRDGHPT